MYTSFMFWNFDTFCIIGPVYHNLGVPLHSFTRSHQDYILTSNTRLTRLTWETVLLPNFSDNDPRFRRTHENFSAAEIALRMRMNKKLLFGLNDMKEEDTKELHNMSKKSMLCIIMVNNHAWICKKESISKKNCT